MNSLLTLPDKCKVVEEIFFSYAGLNSKAGGPLTARSYSVAFLEY